MLDLALTPQQREIVERPSADNDTLFVAGPAGAGKSVALLRRLVHLLARPVRGESILVLVPDRAVRQELERALAGARLGPHGRPVINTYYGLARQMVDLFWPAVAADAGFSGPVREPTFLTYETSQYLMYRIAQPAREKGYFGDLRIRPRRLTSQLLDNLNRAAVNGYAHTEVAERLSRADANPEAARQYIQAQECANAFRQMCLERGALDISLTVEVFWRYLLPQPLFWSFFSRQYRHIIMDNVEESVPAAQDMLRRLLDVCESATLAYDEGGGFRILLGVDPDQARRLQPACRQTIELPDAFVANPDMRRLSRAVALHLKQAAPSDEPAGPISPIAEVKQTGLRSEMIVWTATRIAQLIHEGGARPADIAIICPYADAVLRFGLQEALRAQGIPAQLMRRWISFRDDAVTRGLLTLALLAHPDWQPRPGAFEIAEAFFVLMAGLDLPRAMLLAGRVRAVQGILASPDLLATRDRERIGFAVAEAYEQLYRWLLAYQAEPPAPLDRFLERLFAELLLGPSFWSPAAPASARVACARLIESARQFRLSAAAVSALGPESPALGRAYIEMIDQGIIAGQYIRPPDGPPAEAPAELLITPAYNYLLEGRSSDYQFWMDVGSRQWWRPPHQPLTNALVLRQSWSPGVLWDEGKDEALRNWLLARMTDGLTRRCRRQIFLCGSDLDSLGQTQDGPLLPALLAAFGPEALP
jgi:hypothetical protein